MEESVPAALQRPRRVAVAAAIGAVLALVIAHPVAQTPPATGSASDRRAQLAAAKREGTLTLYTSIAEKDVQTIVRPFETTYGIAVRVWRASTDTVLQRTVAEASARRYDADVVHISAPEMEALARERLLRPVSSPAQADLQPGSVPAHREWAATLLSVWVQAYNTRAIRKDQLPKTYRDLLDPRWKGKLGIEASDQDWFASVVDATGGGDAGLAFFRTLVSTNGLSVRRGHSLLTNLVASGEVPLALTVYSYMPEQAKKKGAPIDWFALEPVVARSNGVGVTRRAPHPNAALLFYEYMLTDAQPRFVGMDYVPTNINVASPLAGRKIVQVSPARALDESAHWTTLFQDTLTRPRR